jgi:ketosteroid isomerase-like protein
MQDNNQQELITRFNEFVSARDLDGLAALMTHDHTFIDTADKITRGKEKALEAWRGFFQHFPDYRNLFDTFTIESDSVTVVGHSVCSDKRLEGPAIWTAKVRGNQVAEWRVYEDTPANRRRLGVSSRPSLADPRGSESPTA